MVYGACEWIFNDENCHVLSPGGFSGGKVYSETKYFEKAPLLFIFVCFCVKNYNGAFVSVFIVSSVSAYLLSDKSPNLNKYSARVVFLSVR